MTEAGSPPTSPPFDQEGAARLLQNALDLWIDPEVQRRGAAGKLPQDFVLSSAQVVFSLDAERPEVRLNHEIRVVAKVKVNRAIQAGEYVMESDVEGFESLELTSADANAAHFTMVFVKNGWFIAFDFRYNASRVAEAVATAREFLDAARDSFKRSQMRAFVDNLFSAVELLAKATLLFLPEKGILEGKRHGAIAARAMRATSINAMSLYLISYRSCGDRPDILRVALRYHRSVPRAC